MIRTGNNQQTVFDALTELDAGATLDQVRKALPGLHPRSVEDALRALVRGGYLRVRSELVEGARCPVDTRGRKKRGDTLGAR